MHLVPMIDRVQVLLQRLQRQTFILPPETQGSFEEQRPYEETEQRA
jgi:hypothetical protein